MNNKSHLKKETIKAYKNILETFNEYCLSKKLKKISQLNDNLYEGFILHLENTGYKKNSINRYISVLNNYFIYLEKNGYINKALYKKHFKKNEKTKKEKYFSEDKIKSIIESIDNSLENYDKYIMIIYLLYFTELKLNNILMLTWDQLKEENQFLVLENKKIALPSIIKKAIKKHFPYKKQGYLIQNYKGNKLSRQSVWRAFDKINKIIKCDISTQGLNHSYHINEMLSKYKEEL